MPRLRNPFALVAARLDEASEEAKLASERDKATDGGRR